MVLQYQITYTENGTDISVDQGGIYLNEMIYKMFWAEFIVSALHTAIGGEIRAENVPPLQKIVQ